jgi:hypothetical protein
MLYPPSFSKRAKSGKALFEKEGGSISRGD